MVYIRRMQRRFVARLAAIVAVIMLVGIVAYGLLSPLYLPPFPIYINDKVLHVGVFAGAAICFSCLALATRMPLSACVLAGGNLAVTCAVGLEFLQSLLPSLGRAEDISDLYAGWAGASGGMAIAFFTLSRLVHPDGLPFP
jgi:VanZ family protein